MSPLLTSVTKQVQNRVHDLSIGAFFIIWRDASVWIGPFFVTDFPRRAPQTRKGLVKRKRPIYPDIS
jgi:hypothetical protein